jgi:two-component system, oxyanion-binding sensor
VSSILTNKKKKARNAMRLGFVALTDCAPLIIAQELDLYEKHGLRVELSRELGWATVRERVLMGELDAAHAPAAMMVAATAGLGSAAVPCMTGLILNLHGNAITLSQRLWNIGVRDGHQLRDYIRKTGNKPVLATVYRWSSHTAILHHWLKQHGIDPERDVQIVVVPPSQMVSNIRAKHIDGFCAGEPWNSMAVMAKIGWVVARSAEIMPGHPEKVLMLRRDVAEVYHDEHTSLIAALMEACAWCDAPENREDIARLLCCTELVPAPQEALLRGMRSTFDYGNGREEHCVGFNIFARDNANEPTAEKAMWVTSQLLSLAGDQSVNQSAASLANECFRADIFSQAKHKTQPATECYAA